MPGVNEKLDHHREDLARHLGAVLGRRVTGLTTLTGGMIAHVVAATLADGATVVAKVDRAWERAALQHRAVTPQQGSRSEAENGATVRALGVSRFDIEATMLRHLRERSALPVPAVLHADSTLLVLEHVAGSPVTDEAEPHLAELLAALHGVTADAFGFGAETLSGTLPLPSPWTASWVAFFRDYRLRYAARAALDNGTLPKTFVSRIDRLADRLDGLLVEPARPALIHGDVWRNNVLAVGPRVTGLIDPSVCYADPEQELAYMALFDGFSPRFFETYTTFRPIDRDFWRVRRHVYQIYPLLLHVYFFGADYLPRLDAALRRLKL